MDNKQKPKFLLTGDWGLGIGDWGLEMEGWNFI